MLVPLCPTQHLSSLHTSLDPDTSKDHSYSSPLSKRQAMIEYNHTQQHGKQLPSDSDHHQCQGAEMLYRLEYEQLAKTS